MTESAKREGLANLYSEAELRKFIAN